MYSIFQSNFSTFFLWRLLSIVLCFEILTLLPLLSVQVYCNFTVLTLATQHQSVSFEIVNKEQITISASLLLLPRSFWPQHNGDSKAINLPGKIPSFFTNWDHGGLEKVQRSKGDIFPVFQDIFHWHGGAQFLRNSQRRKKSRRDSLNGAGIGGFYKSLHSPRLEEQLEGATRIWEVKVAPNPDYKNTKYRWRMYCTFIERK